MGMTDIFLLQGGIHPPQHKLQSSSQPLRTLPLPSQLILPLGQHVGALATPEVAVGDLVLKGQLIASANGTISASIHAPTSGRIRAIEQRPITHPSGMSGPCIVIDTDAQERWLDIPEPVDYRQRSKADLLACIHQAGITGLGGSSFPTTVKLSTEASITTLIVNAAECEPYITADDCLLRYHSAQVVDGIDIVLHLLGYPHCLIAIEDNKPEAIAALRAALQNRTDIDVVVIPTKYPSGGEKQLVQILTGQEVPHGGIPADLGILCQNVGTLGAVADAILQGYPLISRITTVTGSCVGRPGNYRVLLGTPIEHLLTATKTPLDNIERLIIGGPMMGFSLQNIQAPVIKSSNCVLVPDTQELPWPDPAQDCIRCGHCEQVCPAKLLPQQLYWFAKAHEFEKARQYNLMDCIECGACAWVCPSKIPLVQYYRFAKGHSQAKLVEKHRSDHARQRFEVREQRLLQAKVDKINQRQARITTAAHQQAEKINHSQPLSSDKLPSVNPVLQLKQLKTAVALAQTKLKKATQALSDAESMQSPSRSKLATTVATLQAGLAQAEKQLQHQQQTMGLDPEREKSLKIAAAKAQAEVRQLQRTLDDVEESGHTASTEQLATAKTLAKVARKQLDIYLQGDHKT
jgi:Na+-translocating ferredoxin:NAD+ oxidoreductase subunit C